MFNILIHFVFICRHIDHSTNNAILIQDIICAQNSLLVAQILGQGVGNIPLRLWFIMARLLHITAA